LAATGKTPSLVEGISTHITVPLSAEKARAWALDEHGEHKEPLPIESDACGGAVLAIGPRYKTLWYEVKAK